MVVGLHDAIAIIVMSSGANSSGVCAKSFRSFWESEDWLFWFFVPEFLHKKKIVNFVDGSACDQNVSNNINFHFLSSKVYFSWDKSNL